MNRQIMILENLVTVSKGIRGSVKIINRTSIIAGTVLVYLGFKKDSLFLWVKGVLAFVLSLLTVNGQDFTRLIDEEILDRIGSTSKGKKSLSEIYKSVLTIQKMIPYLKKEYEILCGSKYQIGCRTVNFDLYLDYLMKSSFIRLDWDLSPYNLKSPIPQKDWKLYQEDELVRLKKNTNSKYLIELDSVRKDLLKNMKQFYEVYNTMDKEGRL